MKVVYFWQTQLEWEVAIWTKIRQGIAFCYIANFYIFKFGQSFLEIKIGQVREHNAASLETCLGEIKFMEP